MATLWEPLAVSAALMRFQFPVPISVRPELLGTRAKVALPGLRAHFCMPIGGGGKSVSTAASGHRNFVT